MHDPSAETLPLAFPSAAKPSVQAWSLLDTAPMRLAVCGLLIFALSSMAGCIDHPDSPALPNNPGVFDPNTNGPTDTDTNTNTNPNNNDTATGSKALGVIKEAVYVLMTTYDGDKYMCTGTLVAANIVVTAAHCLDDGEFQSFEIVAPFAAGQPRTGASAPQRMSTGYDDNPADPDIGFLWLDDNIELDTYAELTDISQRVESGEAIKASTIVRTEPKAESAFKSVDGLDVGSDVDRGYNHGYSTKYFSNPGDSGAGLFLIENGKVTHKLIGVARQPEKDENLDHFTRVDPDFLQWFHDYTSGD